MNSTERRLNLLVLLQSNQNWNVDDMANHFGVSRRTIFRDLKTFSELNLPVTYDKANGYGMMKGFSIPPIMFTPKEISTILIGLSFVESQVDATLVNDAKAVQYKINSILPTDELKLFMDSLASKTIVDPYKRYAIEKRKGGDWFTIANAIANAHELEFKYRSLISDKESARRVRPYLLVYFTDHWTLVSYCLDRKQLRSFRLDRMSAVEICTKSFSVKKIPTEKTLLFRTSENSIPIVLRVDTDILSRFKSSLPAIIEKERASKDGTFAEVEFSFDNLDYINEWLFTFHSKVKVMYPPDLVEKRVELIRELLRKI
ncbi:MAG: YafY family transcriptional regulator [Balneolales bacterium]|nr:YafY family transcriptional regulator [Balneolales bacterium]